MQLIEINEPAITDTKKTMSMLGEALETDIDKNDTNKISHDENKTISQSCENGKEGKETLQLNEDVVNINGLVKINVTELEDKISDLDQKVAELNKETNGQSNGYSAHSKATESCIDANILEDKKDEMLTNDLIVAEPKIIDSEVSETPSAQEATQTSVYKYDSSKNIDLLIADDNTENISAFSPNSDADEKGVNISSQLQQLDDDPSIDEEVNLSADETISKRTELGILQETELKSLTSVEEKENMAVGPPSKDIDINAEETLKEKEGTVFPIEENENRTVGLPSKDIDINAEEALKEKEGTVFPIIIEEKENMTAGLPSKDIDINAEEALKEKEGTVFPIEENENKTVGLPSKKIDINAEEALKEKEGTVLSDSNDQKLDLKDSEINDEEVLIDMAQTDLSSSNRNSNQKQDSGCAAVCNKNKSNNDVGENPVITEEITVLDSARTVDALDFDKTDKSIRDKSAKVSLVQSSEESEHAESLDVDDNKINNSTEDKIKVTVTDEDRAKIIDDKDETKNILDKSVDMQENESMDIDEPVLCTSEKNTPAAEIVPDTNKHESKVENKESRIKATAEDNISEMTKDFDDKQSTIVEQVEKDVVMEIDDDEEVLISEKSDLPTNTDRNIKDTETSEEITVTDSQMQNKDRSVVISIDKSGNDVSLDIPSSEKSTHKDEIQPENKAKNLQVQDIDSSKVISIDDSVNDVSLDIPLSEKSTHKDEIQPENKVKNLQVQDIDRSKVISIDDSVKDVGEDKKVSAKLLQKDAILKESTDKDGQVGNKDSSELISIDDSVKNAGQDKAESVKSPQKDAILKEGMDKVVQVQNKDSSEVISIDDSVKEAGEDKPVSVTSPQKEEIVSEHKFEKTLPIVCKLSNTMDILSDEEDEPPVKPTDVKEVVAESKQDSEENKCINLDDDDDIMLIEDTNSQEPKLEQNETNLEPQEDKSEGKVNAVNVIDTESLKIDELGPTISEKDNSTSEEIVSKPIEDETKHEATGETKEIKPIITKNFLKSVTKNLAEMTRNELEDFCIVKLVESVVDKSKLYEIKNKMKTMTQQLEDLKKKTLALIKQNRDLQVVIKTVQEDQKNRNPNPMMPMKITRSVGMQVMLTGEKALLKRKLSVPPQPPPMTPARPNRLAQSPKGQAKPSSANIPVPRLVPASSPTLKSPAAPANTTKITPVRNTTPQRPEKRPHTKITSPASSVTVDLTDDEPPAKVITKGPTPPVRLVPSQNLMPKNRMQFTPNNSTGNSNSPRKVYIPISNNNPAIRPPINKNFSPRPRQPSVVRMQTVRMNQAPSVNRHPAPLPDAMKQYQPPTWKGLPPAPDLKLSKVDNGIVISWKFEGYQPDSYEEVASFQLYAYQETPVPPSTALWKKIGDIKALPLPMACTLTQFMSGFKYYFAVRAIDVRSRVGPFSLPGSIMLISKS